MPGFVIRNLTQKQNTMHFQGAYFLILQLIFWSNLNSQVVSPGFYDANSDGNVNTADLLLLLGEFGLSCFPQDTTSDSDFICGNFKSYHFHSYATVEIGNQCWFAENLRTTSYRNGDMLYNSDLSDVDMINAVSGQIGSVTSYTNNNYSNCYEFVPESNACDGTASVNFGYLYNWWAVHDSRQLCPSGWHVPSDLDWLALELFLGIPLDLAYTTGFRGAAEANDLKTELHWFQGGNGENITGLSLPPGGEYIPPSLPANPLHTYNDAGRMGSFWSSSWEESETISVESISNVNSFPIVRELHYNSSKMWRGSQNPNWGLSVRCIKNN